MATEVLEIAVVGAGPAGLMAADVMAAQGARVTIYDRMPSVGRKFLLAGRGGLNLTHSEELDAFIARYGDAAVHLRAAVEGFPPAALRAFSAALGQDTFVGSSGRVFPKSLKTSPLLRAWLHRLDAAGVKLALRHQWRGWDDEGGLLLDGPAGILSRKPAATVLALGGASWPKLGSDGGWADIMATAGIAMAPLRPANCGFISPWTAAFRDRFEGHPLKRIALSFGDTTVRGEAVVTRTGVEGGAIYALSARLRAAIERDGEAMLTIALRPDLSVAELQQRLQAPRGKQSLSNVLRKATKLSPAAIGLLHETAAGSGHTLASLDPGALASLINAAPVRLTGMAALATAISTAGGIAFDEIDSQFMLKKRPGVFAAGEMLDWEAPTGGYLLQACFATGVAAGKGALAWLAR